MASSMHILIHLTSAHIWLHAVLFFADLPVVLGNSKWENGVNKEGKSVQTMKIQAPTMTEEDQYGYSMPDRYKCDSCKAVVYHLDEALKRQQPKSRRLQEWEVEELFQNTCNGAFKGYGIKLIGGENVLSGAGLKTPDNLEPGMGAIQMGGENWEKRLGELCRKFVYDKVGEDQLYDMFFSSRQLSDDLCFKTTKDCQVGPKEPAMTMAFTHRPTGKDTRKPKGKTASKTSKRDGEQPLDFNTFLTKLAVENGSPSALFKGKQSAKHWEETLVRAAEWLSNARVRSPGDAVEV